MAGLAVIGLIAFGLYDSVRVAARKDLQVQESTLHQELAEFMLAAREPDGSSLLEAPLELANASRRLQVTTQKRSFFSYFLSKGNAKDFRVEDVSWEAPRTCFVEFPSASPRSKSVLQACFGEVPRDPTGHYVYFALKYPVTAIARHVRGRSLTNNDRVVLHMRSGDRETIATLVYEPSSFAQARYPSQAKRFEDLHEMTAFITDDESRPSRLVSAQAVVHRDELHPDDDAYVSVLGRMDGSLFGVEGGVWPPVDIAERKIGLEIYSDEHDGAGFVRLFNVGPDEKGTALTSLEQIYLKTVPTQARLDVFASDKLDGVSEPVWSSSSLPLESHDSPEHWWQGISNWWTAVLLSRFERPARLSVSQLQNLAPKMAVRASLTSVPATLPDGVSRAFLWLTLAVIGIVFLGALWLRALTKLWSISRIAYAMTVKPSSAGSLENYAKSRDEIGTIGRVLHVLIARSRTRSANVIKRLEREKAAHIEKVARAQDHLKTRQSILAAIGHEIRSPLQSLIRRATDDADLKRDLERMIRAVEALHEAASVEDGIKSGKIVLEMGDIANYAWKYARNCNERCLNIVYHGSQSNILAVYDDILLAQVFDELVTNADRYRLPGTALELCLDARGQHVVVSFRNEGPPIAFDPIDTIFDYGVSEKKSTSSFGFGLFAARVRIINMGGRMEAQNVLNGVELSIELPTFGPLN